MASPDRSVAWLRWRELGLGLAVFALYELGRLVQVTDPVANGRALLALERALGLAWEAGLQAWVLGHPWLVEVLAWYYVPMHLVPFLGLYLWHLWRQDGAFWTLRRAALAVVLPGILAYSLVPVAPPRVIDGAGVVDLVAISGAIGLDEGLLAHLANPSGAFPSEHVTWAIVVAWALTRLHDRRLWPLGMVHVLVTCLGVVATGHHYVLDVLAGLVLGGVAVWVAERVAFPGEPPGKPF